MAQRDKTRQSPAKQRTIARRIARHSKAVAIAMAQSATSATSLDKESRHAKR